MYVIIIDVFRIHPDPYLLFFSSIAILCSVKSAAEDIKRLEKHLSNVVTLLRQFTKCLCWINCEVYWRHKKNVF